MMTNKKRKRPTPEATTTVHLPTDIHKVLTHAVTTTGWKIQDIVSRAVTRWAESDERKAIDALRKS
jgi:hypothetical protein